MVLMRKVATAFIGAAFSVSMLVTPGDAAAQVQFIRNSVQPLTKGPGGSKKGELYLNTGVIVTEERGDWVKVTVHGWVRKDSLKSRPEAGTSSLRTVNEPSLEVLDYSVREVKEGLSEPRLYLSLQLKNASAEPVRRWKGLLVAQSPEGTVLFRQAVSDENTQIPAEGEASVNFYWVASEEPYTILRGATPDTLKLQLFKVDVN